MQSPIDGPGSPTPTSSRFESDVADDPHVFLVLWLLTFSFYGVIWLWVRRAFWEKIGFATWKPCVQAAVLFFAVGYLPFFFEGESLLLGRIAHVSFSMYWLTVFWAAMRLKKPLEEYLTAASKRHVGLSPLLIFLYNVGYLNHALLGATRVRAG